MDKWTTEKPKANGWYWAKQNSEDEIEIVQVFEGEVATVFYDAWVDISSFSHWLGPLSVPESPNG